LFALARRVSAMRHRLHRQSAEADCDIALVLGPSRQRATLLRDRPSRSRPRLTRRAPPAAGGRMKPQDHIPAQQAMATLRLPSLRHARSLMDVFCAREAITGKAVRLEPADPVLVEEAENLKVMFTTFTRLQERAKS